MNKSNHLIEMVFVGAALVEWWHATPENVNPSQHWEKSWLLLELVDDATLPRTVPSGCQEDGTTAAENNSFKNFITVHQNLENHDKTIKNLHFSLRISDSRYDKRKKIIDSSGHLTVFSILTKIADVIHSSGLRIFVKIIGN